jgi:putative endonuclease
MFTVYILYSPKYKKTYAGQTSDLGKRMDFHNEKSISTFTSKFRPWILLYSENFPTRIEVMKREKWFKSGVGREFIKRIKEEYLKS